MKDELVRRLSLENELRCSIDRGELAVFYQPQADVRTGKIVGVEALLRRPHPQRGLMSPDDFIPIAEETGLIIPLGGHVLLEACRRAAEWERRGLKLMRVAVNLSTRQLHAPEILTIIRRALSEADLPPERLELEITELAAVGDPERTVRTLTRLEHLGVRVSTDDFGTGYSSLAYLKHLPIPALKIDSAFVRDLTTSPKDAAITRAIIAMAHSSSLCVVAEGVETEQQLQILRDAGCDDYQGYLLSEPRPAEEIERLLKR
jgi:EAL domain-containing protein (putative c-di-GMP-specific phosphodiesterase class I)